MASQQINIQIYGAKTGNLDFSFDFGQTFCFSFFLNVYLIIIIIDDLKKKIVRECNRILNGIYGIEEIQINHRQISPTPQNVNL